MIQIILILILIYRLCLRSPKISYFIVNLKYYIVVIVLLYENV